MRSILLLVALSTAASAQPITPASVGFTHVHLDTPETGPVSFYVSTAGRPADTTRTLPLVVYHQGSGYNPIYWGSRDSLRNALLLDPRDVPEAHYIVIGKPGAPFWIEDFDNRAEPPAAFTERLSLHWRTAAARLAIEHVMDLGMVDPSLILSVGHSEGADVAPWVAVEVPAVTHVAVLAGGALSMSFDFVYEFRRLVAEGEMTFDEGQRYIEQAYADLRATYAEPTRTDTSYYGGTLLKWHSFLDNPPLDAMLQLDVPIYIAGGTLDEKAPIANLDMAAVAFIRRGKDNLTYRVWEADHSFRQPTENGSVDLLRTIVAD
ncbi:MAG: hypothetical protein AAGK21_16935, partial [Bacteroidota bacterium]